MNKLFQPVEDNYKSQKGKRGFMPKNNPLEKSYKLRLTENEHRALLMVAKRLKMPVSHVIRHSLITFIEQKEIELPDLTDTNQTELTL